MKKLALAAALAAAAVPSLASAQIVPVLSATATIQTVLNFGTPQSLDFGSVMPGTGATATGWIPINRNVGVTFTLPDGASTGRLTRAGGTETLQPSLTCGVGSTSSAVTSAFSTCAPATAATGVLTLPAPASVVTEYVIVGGTLTGAQTSVPPGTYSGTVRILATAN